LQAGGHRFDSDILHFTLRSLGEGGMIVKKREREKGIRSR